MTRLLTGQVQIRRIGAGALVVAGFAAAWVAPARADLPPELKQDLVAYYPFDETSGTVVNDRSGKNNHAAIVNSNASTVWNGGPASPCRAATAGRRRRSGFPTRCSPA